MVTHINTHTAIMPICTCAYILALSPGHSQLFVVSRETIKSWEWPGDEATYTPYCRIHTGWVQ